MKSRQLALKVTLQSSIMLIGVYLVLQTLAYIRDNVMFGSMDLSGMIGSVMGFMFTVVIPPVVFFSIVIFLVAHGIQKVHTRLERGEQLEPQVIERTRKRILGFSSLILTVNLIGFVAGFVLTFAGHFENLLSPRNLMVLVSNIAGAFVYATAQTSLHNIAFADLRERLQIHEFGGRKKQMRSTQRQVILTGLIVLYGATYIQFNLEDVNSFHEIGAGVEKKVIAGEIEPSAAADAYHKQLAADHLVFTGRSEIFADSIKTPWERIDSPADISRFVFILMFGFILLVGIGVQLAASFEMRDQIKGFTSRLGDVVTGGGDLRSRMSIRSMDDIGELTEVINKMLDQFSGIVTRIGSSARENNSAAAAIDQVLSESESVASRAGDMVKQLQTELEIMTSESRALSEVLESFRIAAQSVDAASETQRRFVTETSSAMEEMASSIESVETMTTRAGGISGDLAQRGTEGGIVVQETSGAIMEIQNSAKKVLEVLGSLNKIAAETNLLAMNAAIEAAHAGDKGRGFAVVADEVRKLSSTAASETKIIRDLVNNMALRVNQGVEKAKVSGEVLERLVQGLHQSASISREIEGAMKEQAVGTRLVADSLIQVVDASEEIRTRMSEQSRQTDNMADSLQRALTRVQTLLEASQRQTDAVRALELSFEAVRVQVGRNRAAVDTLNAEIARFRL